MAHPIQRLAAAALLMAGLCLPAGAQTMVNPGDYGRDIDNPTVMEPVEAPSSSVRPPAAEQQIIQPSPGQIEGVTRLREDVGDAPQPQQLDNAAAGPEGADTLADVLNRETPAQAGGLEQLGQMMTGGGPRSAASAELGTTVGPSGELSAPHNDQAMWNAVRENTALIDTQVRGPATDVLIQDGGMTWLTFRQGPLLTWGGWLLLGTLIALLAFFLIRGRIRIQGHKTGFTIERFAFVERFGHWLTAGSFILLGITGLLVLFGRTFLIPLFGHQAYSPIAIASKWVHNNVSWAFMLGIVLIFVMWVAQNLPSRTDLAWIAKGGGMFSKDSHVHARKFNAGQKIVFWSVILLGISISLSGLSLMFPMQFQLFSHTFEFLNWTRLPQLFLGEPLIVNMSPQHEMQLAQAWHAIVAFLYIAIILGHIYIGTVGMEGAFDAMGSGDVEVQWAREHHDLWYEEATGRDAHEYIPPPPETAARRS
ncbi:formate dehydrogenase subunit gamma [Paracoccus tegillarcae]|nr:formate dehydrogenase subunit gamma [Paracoccus tegillarcae]